MNLGFLNLLISIATAYGTMIVAGGLPVDRAIGFQASCDFLDISKKASISDWHNQKRRQLTTARGDAMCCAYDGWFLNFGGIANTGKPTDVCDALNLRRSNTKFQVILM